jgi:hypothetical protein
LFYIDRRLGTGGHQDFLALNSAVDTRTKKEFDIHRMGKHPLMKAYGVDAVPFQQRMMDEWRENFKGVQYHHEPTNFIITGLWIRLVNLEGELIVVDYKSTSRMMRSL